MGIFDKIKFKKDEAGDTVQKSEKTGTHEPQTQEVEKASKIMPHIDGDKTSMKKDAVASLQGVIVRPHITEKSAHLAGSNKYVFVVDSNATRVQIKQAVRSMYGILPVSVNVSNVIGKSVRFGRRRGKRKDWKKAVVTLPKGKTIDVYEGV